MASDAAGQTGRQMEILLRRLPHQQALGPDRQALQHVPAVRIQGKRDKGVVNVRLLFSKIICQVLLGKHDLSSEEGTQEEKYVTDMFFPPMPGDIALWKLQVLPRDTRTPRLPNQHFF